MPPLAPKYIIASIIPDKHLQSMKVSTPNLYL